MYRGGGRPIPGGKRYYRLGVWPLCGIFLFARPGEADDGKSITIEDGAVSAEIELIDAFQAEQERLKKLLASKPRAYQDNFMEASQLPEPESEPEEEEPEPEGVRVYSLESRVDFADSTATDTEGQRVVNGGIRTEYRLETPNHGEIIFQLDARGRNVSDGADGSTLLATEGKQKNVRTTVRNISLPVTTEILADSSAGDISSEITEALGRNYRLALGTSPVRGVGSHVYGKDFDLRVGTGLRGELLGGPYPGFEETEGHLSWLGYSHKLNDKVRVGVQIDHAQDVPVWDVNNPATTIGNEDITSFAASAGYGYGQLHEGDFNVRGTFVTSKTSAVIENHKQTASGLFIEAGFRKGRYLHDFGAYAAQPNLYFGDNLLLSDNRGVYWRFNRESSRLNIGGAVDIEQYNPAGEAESAFSRRIGLNGNVVYRFNRDDQIGGNLHLGNTHSPDNDTSGSTASDSRSTNLNLFYQTRFNNMGPSRFSATVRRNEALVSNGVTATGDEIQWQQDWITGKYETMRPELKTTLGVAHDRSGTETQTYPTAAVSGRYWLDADWNVSGNLQYTSRTGNLSTSQGLSGTVATEYKLGREWQIGASANINEARVDYSGSSLSEPQVFRTNDKYAHVYLRWQKTQGKPYQVLGERTEGMVGSGDISGVLYFDENRDGIQQPDEAGVPGVEVLLDGHYRAMTDTKGVFQFVQVAAGSHQLGLNLDSVPLPWGADDSMPIEVTVPLRGQVRSIIPLIKING